MRASGYESTSNCWPLNTTKGNYGLLACTVIMLLQLTKLYLSVFFKCYAGCFGFKVPQLFIVFISNEIEWKLLFYLSFIENSFGEQGNKQPLQQKKKNNNNRKYLICVVRVCNTSTTTTLRQTKELQIKQTNIQTYNGK